MMPMFQNLQSVSQDIEFENIVAQWSSLPYAQLSALLVMLKFALSVHQTHHWQAKDDAFYGDHKLFQSLYEKIEDDIDTVAEKVVGLATPNNVNIVLQTQQVARLARSYDQMNNTIPSSNDLAHKSLMIETRLLRILSCVRESLKASNTLTLGVDNMLADLYDDHEGHVYLLKQRCSK